MKRWHVKTLRLPLRVTFFRKLNRALHLEASMGTDPVVFPPPVFDDHSRLGQRPEPFPIQAFSPQPGVEALDVTVLPRTAWLDI